MSRRVVLLCLDSLPKPLTLQGAADGTLPAFARLLKTARYGDTMNVRGFYSGSSWPSFTTACFPARHGIYSWKQLVPGTYREERYLTGDHIRREPFWTELSRAGKRVAVLDVPATKVRPVNGIQVSEWGCHEDIYGLHSSPADVAGEIEQRFGLHPIGQPREIGRGPDEMAEFKRRLLAGVALKARLTRDFLAREPWDFFCQVFTEPHDAGHMCWHLHDPAHPWHTPELVAAAGDPVVETMAAVDRALGEVLDAVDDDVTVFVLLSHGMGPTYGARHLLEPILIGLGHAAPVPAAPPRPQGLGERLDRAATWTWQRLPVAVRRSLEPLKKRVRGWIDEEERSPPPLVVRAESRCFTVTSPSTSAIRVNLEGREPEGKVSRSEHDAFCEQLCRELLELRNVDTNAPVVDKLVRVAETYDGPFLDDIPDIMVEWRRDAPVRGVRSERLGEVMGEYSYVRSGDHQPEGMLFAYGPGIAPGHFDGVPSIVDIGPTVAELLGVRLEDVDGRPITGLVT